MLADDTLFASPHQGWNAAEYEVAKKVATIDDPNANFLASEAQLQPVDPVVILHHSSTDHLSDNDCHHGTLDANMEPLALGTSFKASEDHLYEIAHADDASKVLVLMKGFYQAALLPCSL